MFAASPIECAPVAHADTAAKFGPCSAEAHRDRAGRTVNHQQRHGERAHLRRSALEEDLVLRLERLDPADAGTDDDAGAARVVRATRSPARLLDGLDGRRDRELREPVRTTRVALLHEVRRHRSPSTSARDLTPKSSVSKRVTGPAPDSPDTSAFHDASAPTPKRRDGADTGDSDAAPWTCTASSAPSFFDARGRSPCRRRRRP